MNGETQCENVYLAVAQGDAVRGDTSDRWSRTIRVTNSRYASLLGFDNQSRMKVLFQKSLWALSFSKDTRICDIAKLAYDGDFFDEIFDSIPNGKRKDNAIDELTAMSDADAAQLARLVELPDKSDMRATQG